MQYDLNLTANGGQQLDAVGHFIKYKAGAGDIRVTTPGGLYVDLSPGQAIRLPKAFSSLNVRDRSGNANVGVLLAGDFDFVDDAVPGTVSVVDGNKANTVARNCFAGYVNSTGTAGMYNGCALINPAGSGVNLVVPSIKPTLSASGFLYAYLVAIAPSLNLHAQNKFGGGAPSKANIEQIQLASYATLGTMFAGWQQNAGLPNPIKFDDPMVVPPGMGIVVMNNALATAVYTNFEFREDAI